MVTSMVMRTLNRIKLKDQKYYSMLGLPIQCHTTDLQVAFGMDTGDQYMNKCKAKFF
jgi:hypothetical protein